MMNNKVSNNNSNGISNNSNDISNSNIDLFIYPTSFNFIIH